LIERTDYRASTTSPTIEDFFESNLDWAARKQRKQRQAMVARLRKYAAHIRAGGRRSARYEASIRSQARQYGFKEVNQFFRERPL
jgi:hypothetical protein